MKKSLAILVLIFAINLWSTIGFVVNSGSETLSRIDFETGEIDNAFSVLGSMPNRVALTQEFAYVVNSGDNNIQKINLQTGNTETVIFIGLSTNPYDIFLNEDFAYVSGGLSNKVYKIDLSLDEVIDEVEVGGNPAGMAIFGGKLYVGNTDYSNYYTNCTLSIIDLQTFSVTNTIPTEINPQFLEVINDQIHISCGGDWGNIGGKICILDPILEEISEVIEIGGVTYNLAQTPNEIVYVSDGFGYNLFAYDADDFSVIYNNANPFTPGGTMVAADDENLFVLGGEWGQNFTVKKFDFNENLIDEYEVALYATDIKLMPDETGITNYQLPVTYYQLSNYPNPFNPSTEITFNLITKDAKNVNIEVYNLKGQKVNELVPSLYHPEPVEGRGTINKYTVVWEGIDQTSKPVSSGVYLYRLKVDGVVTASSKMILIK
ncbi:MAG: hypothetical protein K9N09_00510 [Candidatus Cloacimonetes bacterium]|nr:hypothetical protein [Candidatus Cloacimonadota bacterium]MCF7812944.1 hypothetical protein [Candidatus Cloacimonadota bacterium]MCF7867155.1 hypothetical protein [Candidatus Cloacimonadota bacterium]MCF7882525.1 hypothetical protein [Candidatus Cloacimonadota bacterium]